MIWISVKERLPRKLQKVLFHWVTHGHLRNISMGYMCAEGWNIYLPYHSFGLRGDICPVTHWAELPEFPEYDIPPDFNANVARLFKDECEHENLDMEPGYQCEDCKQYVRMD
jgi:hypothetical protein